MISLHADFNELAVRVGRQAAIATGVLFGTHEFHGGLLHAKSWPSISF
jgi:hypothetical protein